MNGYTWGWIAWAAVGAVFEAYTLLNRGRGDTLSEQVWRLLVHPFTPQWFVALGLLAWAATHFLIFGRLG